MNTKLNLFKKLSKKFTAAALAIITVVGSAPIDLEVLAAKPLDPSKYYIKFIDNNYPTEKETTISMICEAGETTKVETRLPEGYSMSKDPFRIFEGASGGLGTDVTDKKIITAQPSANMYTIAVDHNKVVFEDADNGMKGYTMEAAYSSPNDLSGAGSASWTSLEYEEENHDDPSKPPIKHPAGNVTSIVVATPEVSPPLISDTTIEFDYKKIPGSSGVISNFHATGYYGLLLGTSDSDLKSTVAMEEENNGKQRLRVVFTSTNDSNANISFDFTNIDVDKWSYAHLDKLHVSATFSVPRVNNLILQLHTLQKAIEQDATDLQAITSRGPEYTLNEAKKPYMVLNAGDKLGLDGGIATSSIAVLPQVPRYNSKLYIKWKFEPDDKNINPDNVVIWEEGSSVLRIIEPTADDIKGKLIATICYRKPDGTEVTPPSGTKNEVKIPIKVLGAGSPAKINFTEQKRASYKYNGGKFTEETSIEEILTSPRTFEMEVYDGKVSPETYMPKEATSDFKLGAFLVSGRVDFGKSKGAAKKLVVEQKQVGGQGKVKLTYGEAADYKWGSDILPPKGGSSADPGSMPFSLTALEEGNVLLTFTFYNAKGDKISPATTISISISDLSPSDDSKLKTLDLKAVKPTTPPTGWADFEKLYPNSLIGFGFSPETTTYQTPIKIPNIVENVTLTPKYIVDKNMNNVTATLNGATFEGGNNTAVLKKGESTPSIPLEVGKTVKVTLDCIAQNGFTLKYTLTLLREGKSNDGNLADLIVKPRNDSTEADYYIKTPDPFDPEKLNYEVHVPYGQKTVFVGAIARDYWASSVKIEPIKTVGAGIMGALAKVFKQAVWEEVKLNYNENTGANLTEVTITVTPEDGSTPKVYKLNIYRDDPSEDATMVEPKVSYWLKGTTRPKDEKPAKLDNYDETDKVIYTEKVEYTTNRVKLLITPNDYRASEVSVALNTGTAVKKPHKGIGTKAQPVEFIFENVGTQFSDRDLLKFTVTITAEKPNTVTAPPYEIYVERKPPSTDTRADVTITNTVTKTPIDFGYQDNPSFDTYPTKEIDFVAGDVQALVQVKPKDEKTTVTVQGNPPRGEGTSVKLIVGTVVTVKIVLTAEDGSTRTITIPLLLKNPSNACYLVKLDAGGLPYLPDPTLFDKKKTSYSIEVPKGTETLSVTPTLLKDGTKEDSTHASITVNGVAVKDGTACPVKLSDKTGKITVVVVAQDGKTKRTYTINYKNWNLIVPGDENLLKDLKVDYGDLTPKFSPETQEYDVYVKPDAMKIKIIPKLKDKNGKLRVVAGKVLPEFEGGYTTSLMDDTLDIHIYVWSEADVVESNSATGGAGGAGGAAGGESAGTGTSTDMKLDKAKARDYVIHLYRNDDTKIGHLKPITADKIDFTGADPIVIDITQYPIIAADVFNTLKTDYADKSILFKGSDYTLQCFGADINGLVPNTESYDLRFSFTTPDEQKILDLMDESGSNGNIDPVYCYFDQHGALPAEMLLTVDMGRHYSNDYLYWNYYNQDQTRIDYYGYVKANAKGTFSVPISHFSTFIVTDKKIRGAENKSDQYGNPTSATPENLNAPGSVDKAIPNTGVEVN